jgi:hypothetical protein
VVRFAAVFVFSIFSGCFGFPPGTYPPDLTPNAIPIPRETASPTWKIVEVYLDQGCTQLAGTFTWDQVKETAKSAQAYPMFIVYQTGQSVTNTIDGCYQDFPQQLYSPNPTRPR